MSVRNDHFGPSPRVEYGVYKLVYRLNHPPLSNLQLAGTGQLRIEASPYPIPLFLNRPNLGFQALRPASLRARFPTRQPPQTTPYLLPRSTPTNGLPLRGGTSRASTLCQSSTVKSIVAES